VKIDDKEIIRRNPILWITIEPKPKTLTPLVVIDNQKKEITYSEQKKKWFADVSSLSSGLHKIVIKIGEFEKEFEIKITGGIKERDLL